MSTEQNEPEETDHRGDDRGPKAPGPAEEENSESGDDRGLTTDASPSD